MNLEEWIRPPVVAGTFYPSDPAKLKNLLKEFCSRPSPTPLVATAVMAPHAGYIYSGGFAGAVYEKIEVPRDVILLCPNHTGLGAKISVWAHGAWETPLGRVPVAESLAAQILEALPNAEADRLAHAREHAIEVHLPFLQYRNPNVNVVPIVLGRLSWEQCEQLGDALAKIVSENPETLVVASTDMSHYLSRAKASEKDRLALGAVTCVDPALLYDTVVRYDISMCGFIPTVISLQMCRRLETLDAHIVAYGDSGERTGDLDSVVGYASAYIA